MVKPHTSDIRVTYEYIRVTYGWHTSTYVTRMSSVCHSYLLVCHSYVIRMSLVCGFTMNPPRGRCYFGECSSKLVELVPFLILVGFLVILIGCSIFRYPFLLVVMSMSKFYSFQVSRFCRKAHGFGSNHYGKLTF